MQDALDQSKRLKSDQRQSHLLLIRGRPSDEDCVDELVEGRLLDQQQMLDYQLLDHVELDLNRLRT